MGVSGGCAGGADKGRPECSNPLGPKSLHRVHTTGPRNCQSDVPTRLKNGVQIEIETESLVGTLQPVGEIHTDQSVQEAEAQAGPVQDLP